MAAKKQRATARRNTPGGCGRVSAVSITARPLTGELHLYPLSELADSGGSVAFHLKRFHERLRQEDLAPPAAIAPS
jgi:hypothetical protein